VKRHGHKSLVLPIVLVLASFGESPQPVSSAASAATLLAEAQKFYRTGNFDGAIDKYKRILEEDPKSADAYAGMVRVYRKQERVQQAYEAALSGTAANPASSSVQTALGEVYFREGKLAEAEQQFIKVVNSSPPDARAYLGLARIGEAISMYKKAKELIDRAHELDSSDPDIQKFWMGTLKPSERIRLLESYLDGPTNDDTEDRERMARYLELLKARQKRPGRKCRLATNLTSTQTELMALLIDANHMHGFGLNVKFNGHSAHLLLDTGAGGIIVKKSVAEKAGITPVVQSRIEGIGDKGSMGSYFGFADSIRVGELEFKDCMVEVSEKRSILGDDGLIGASVFSDYLVSLDFPRSKLKLSELPKRPDEKDKPVILKTGDSDGYSEDNSETSPSKSAGGPETDPGPQDRYIAPAMQSYSRIFRFGHDLLIPTRIGDGRPKLFLIDTGAMMNAISPEAAREVTKVHNDSDTIVKGLSGKVNNVYRADKATLQFSRYRQENQDLTALDLSRLSKDAGTEVSGILGFTTLRMFEMKIDYRDGLVDFVFDEQRYGR
jgi:tetratricopeptide (TPR) repeat protein